MTGGTAAGVARDVADVTGVLFDMGVSVS